MDPLSGAILADQGGNYPRFLGERARQCLSLQYMPRLGLDRRPGSRACLLEAVMLVGDGGVVGDRKFLQNGDCGGAALLATACGTFRGRRESRR